jgi:hypothetical protein
VQRLWLLGVALWLVAALVSPRAADAQGPAPAPLAVVAAGLAAVNAGNVAALGVVITETTSLEIVSGPAATGLRIEGREAVLGFWRQAEAVGLQARPVGPLRVAGDRVTGTLRFTDRERRARGEAGQVTVEVAVAGGRIVALVVRDIVTVSLSQFEALPGGMGLPRTGTGGGLNPASLLAGVAGLGGLAGLGGVTLALALRGGRRRPPSSRP